MLHIVIGFVIFSDQTTSYDHSGKTSYIEECKKLGVVPASYFLRHMHDRHLSMRHHGLGAVGMKAIADSLTVSTCTLTLRHNYRLPRLDLAFV